MYLTTHENLTLNGCTLTINTFDRPIIILSAPRSGSTLLFETLTNAKELYSIGDESHAIIEHIPKLSTVARGFKSNALHACDADPVTAELLRQRFKELLRDREGNAYLQGSGRAIRFLEKTPKNSLRIEFLNKVFPDALFIYLVRDPKANISSIMDAWQSGHFRTYPNLPGFQGRWSLFLPENWQQLQGKSLQQIATYQWQQSNASIIGDLTKLDSNRWRIVNYQDLIDNPEKVIASISKFIDIDIDQKFKATYENGLPLSQYTLTRPDKNKWHKRAHLLPECLATLKPLIKDLNKALHDNEQPLLTIDINDEILAEASRLHAQLQPSTAQQPSGVKPPVSRNASCPCGSGKRFKQCHGQLS